MLDFLMCGEQLQSKFTKSNLFKRSASMTAVVYHIPPCETSFYALLNSTPCPFCFSMKKFLVKGVIETYNYENEVSFNTTFKV